MSYITNIDLLKVCDMMIKSEVLLLERTSYKYGI